MSSHFDRIQENINILRYNVGVTQNIEDVKKYEDNPEKMSNFSLSRMTSPGFSEWETLDSNPNYECKDGVCRLKNDKEKEIPDMRRRFKSDEIFGKRFQTDLISPFNGPLFMNRELNPTTSDMRERQENDLNQLPETYSNPIREQQSQNQIINEKSHNHIQNLQPSHNHIQNLQASNQILNDQSTFNPLSNNIPYSQNQGMNRNYQSYNQNFMNNNLKYNTASYASWDGDDDNTYRHTMSNTEGKIFNRESNYVEGGTKLFRIN